MEVLPIAPAKDEYVGVIKSFDPNRGFGFIACKETHSVYSRDVFLHRSLVGNFQVGDAVSFKVRIDPLKGNPQASLVRAASRSPTSRTSATKEPTEMLQEFAELSRSDTEAGNSDAERPRATPPPASSSGPRASSQGPRTLSAHEYTGTIKSFDSNNGFGFIACEETNSMFGRDVFLHHLQRAGFEVGDAVSFRIHIDPVKGFPKAAGLHAPGTPAPSVNLGRPTPAPSGAGVMMIRQNVCWDFTYKGSCPRAARCRFAHGPNLAETSRFRTRPGGFVPPALWSVCIHFLGPGCRFSADQCSKRHPEEPELSQLKEAAGNTFCRFGIDCRIASCAFKHDAPLVCPSAPPQQPASEPLDPWSRWSGSGKKPALELSETTTAAGAVGGVATPCRGDAGTAAPPPPPRPTTLKGSVPPPPAIPLGSGYAPPAPDVDEDEQSGRRIRPPVESEQFCDWTDLSFHQNLEKDEECGSAEGKKQHRTEKEEDGANGSELPEKPVSQTPECEKKRSQECDSQSREGKDDENLPVGTREVGDDKEVDSQESDDEQCNPFRDEVPEEHVSSDVEPGKKMDAVGTRDAEDEVETTSEVVEVNKAEAAGAPNAEDGLETTGDVVEPNKIEAVSAWHRRDEVGKPVVVFDASKIKILGARYAKDEVQKTGEVGEASKVEAVGVGHVKDEVETTGEGGEANKREAVGAPDAEDVVEPRSEVVESKASERESELVQTKGGALVEAQSWQRYCSEDGGFWWWCEASSEWFTEEDPGSWCKYLDPESGRHFWWRDDSSWFWLETSGAQGEAGNMDDP